MKRRNQNFYDEENLFMLYLVYIMCLLNNEILLQEGLD